MLREIALAVERGYHQMQPLEHFIIPFTEGHQAGELTDEDLEHLACFSSSGFRAAAGFRPPRHRA